MSSKPLLSAALIAQLRCPETRQPLVLADDTALERICVSANNDDCDGALIREDGLRAYPVRDGFPILLIDEAITLDSRD